MKIFNIFKKKYRGVIKDPRPIEERLLDYKHEDLVMGTVGIHWVENKTLKAFEIQNQDGSLSCVAQSVAKLLGMHEVFEGREYKRLCPKFIYTRRANYPDGGMWMPNALAIAKNFGACEETFMPCDDKDEAFMNNKTEPVLAVVNAFRYKGLAFFEITNRTVDNIAEVLERGYGVTLGFRFDYNEWTDYPTIREGSTRPLGHAVACVDYTLIGGKKYLVIEDSWGLQHARNGVRFISEEFLTRCFYAGYITSFTELEKKYIFTKVLRFGSRGLDVKMLQRKLGISDDGIFGKQTLKAVKDFQAMNGLYSDGIVGRKTNAVLNR